MRKLKFNDWRSIIKDTFHKWWNDDPFRQSAIIAFYAVFSLPVLLVIVIYFVGIAFSQDALNGKIAASISATLGQDTALMVQSMIVQSSQGKNSVMAIIIGIATLIFTATGVFIELQKYLNTIWQIRPQKTQGFLKSVEDRLFSFMLVVSIGILLAVSFVLSPLLTILNSWFNQHFSIQVSFLLHSLNFVFSLSTVSVLFAIMYKVLPDTPIRWQLIWPGALLTALLFTLGKYMLGYYFLLFQPASIYGVAGSALLILLWISYSCMIVLLGAQFTRQFSLRKEN